MTDTRDAAGGSADRLARIALTALTEPGNRHVWSLVQESGAPATLERLLRGELSDALRLTTMRMVIEGGLDPWRIAEAALAHAERLGIRLVVPADPEWPQPANDLAALPTTAASSVNQHTRPPLCLWVRGFWPLNDALRRSVAVVGARAATPYGLHVATDLAHGLARDNWTIVSGGSFGIDAAAHRAALAAEGRTVAILPCGLDRPHPAGNAALLEQIAETGLLISPWPPGSEPLKHRLLFRSRLIASVTRGTVLVEAAARSDATHTMQQVLSLRRTAMVVPGPVTSAMSEGCHALLRSHSRMKLVTGLPHVLEILDAKPGSSPTTPTTPTKA